MFMHLPATATELNTSARAAEFNVFHDFKGFLDSFLMRWKGHKGKRRLDFDDDDVI
jgi:acetone carboxylase gamma subunit